MNCLRSKDDDLHKCSAESKCSVNIGYHNNTHDDDFK